MTYSGEAIDLQGYLPQAFDWPGFYVLLYKFRQMKKSFIAACLGSLYVLAYVVAFNFNAPTDVTMTMFIFSPFVVIGMTVTILKDSTMPVRELKEGEEWGYQDRGV